MKVQITMITVVYTYIKLESKNKIRKRLPIDIKIQRYKTLFIVFFISSLSN